MKGNLFLLLPIFVPVAMALVQYYVRLTAKGRNVLTVLTLAATAAMAVYAAMHQGMECVLWNMTDRISIAFRVDGLSVLYLSLISIVWACVGLYATEYLEHDASPRRFYLFYLITLGVLMGLSMAKNLITLYMFYELMTLLSMPLVLHNLDKESVAAALKYLLYSVFGASAALLGVFYVGANAPSFDFIPGGQFGAEGAAVTPVALAIFFVMIVGFGVKAGMFPMHSWLPTAHPVAPAPASAVLSGVITKAGVLGILRTIYYVAGVEALRGTWVQYAFMVLTLITVILGSLMAFKEKHFKRRLAYSTVSQVSYVLFGLSTMTKLGFIGALLHIVFHSLIKDTLFMSAGAVIHKTGKTSVDELRGIGKRMPATMWCFTIVSLGLVGIPPTGGFISKWNIAEGAMTLSNAASWIGPACLLVSAILTAAYLLSVSIRAFFPGEDMPAAELSRCEASWRMIVPMALLSVLVVALGMFPGALLNLFGTVASAVAL